MKNHVLVLNGNNLFYYELNGDKFVLVEFIGADLKSCKFAVVKSDLVQILDPNKMIIYKSEILNKKG